uniref:Uncharacterized protein n=1 Tax=Ananas comosus var. bracteatus TaxID=296719 RepID=A0A6V7NHK2_ANACO|nr:unnamed protein product [Ananas comosus var. bracteatus]
MMFSMMIGIEARIEQVIRMTPAPQQRNKQRSEPVEAFESQIDGEKALTRGTSKDESCIKETCRVITISDGTSENFMIKRRQDKRPIAVNTNEDDIWDLYETSSPSNEMKRLDGIEPRLLGVECELKILRLEVRSLKRNLDCVATGVKSLSTQMKDIMKSDDDEELLQLIQQFQAKEKPWGEDSCDEEEADAICNDISEVKVIKRTLELSENPLSIIRAPEKHYKALPARVMMNVTNLDTFFVPPKVEVVNGKKEVIEGILFYKSEYEKHVDLIELENSDDETFEDITIPRYFSNKLKSVIHRSGCPTRRSRSDRKRCQKMWDIPQNRIVFPNGRTSHTRGLGSTKILRDILIHAIWLP